MVKNEMRQTITGDEKARLYLTADFQGRDGKVEADCGRWSTMEPHRGPPASPAGACAAPGGLPQQLYAALPGGLQPGVGPSPPQPPPPQQGNILGAFGAPAQMNSFAQPSNGPTYPSAQPPPQNISPQCMLPGMPDPQSMAMPMYSHSPHPGYAQQPGFAMGVPDAMALARTVAHSATHNGYAAPIHQHGLSKRRAIQLESRSLHTSRVTAIGSAKLQRDQRKPTIQLNIKRIDPTQDSDGKRKKSANNAFHPSFHMTMQVRNRSRAHSAMMSSHLACSKWQVQNDGLTTSTADIGREVDRQLAMLGVTDRRFFLWDSAAAAHIRTDSIDIQRGGTWLIHYSLVRRPPRSVLSVRSLLSLCRPLLFRCATMRSCSRSRSRSCCRRPFRPPHRAAQPLTQRHC